MKVPTPGRGYWAKVNAGKAQSKPSLPDALPGDELEWARQGIPRRAPSAPPKAPERLPQGKAIPPVSGTSHALVVAGREHFGGAKESDAGYLKPSKKALLDLFVSRALLDRALKVADVLYRSLEVRGHRVILAPTDHPYRRPDVDERKGGGPERLQYDRWNPSRPTVVFVGTVTIGLSLFEISERAEVRYVDGKYVRVKDGDVAGRSAFDRLSSTRELPTGRLRLRASSPYSQTKWERQWSESDSGELESLIPEIISEIEQAAPTVAKLAEEAERKAKIEAEKWEAERIQWQQEQAERERACKVKESLDELNSIIDEWARAKRIEEFFKDAEARLAAMPGDSENELLKRLQQARTLLGDVNALQRLLSWKAPDER